ncbi:MAG: tyrosine-type recombinase/integrase [Polaromonas sp.]|nr:tyrosine-type recombinase/integrase [Polaromonas sp.]
MNPMPSINKLSALAISRLQQPGYYSDGGNLILQVTASGSKSWLFRYSKGKRKREMGLGPLPTVSLANAREKAAACRLQLLEGEDPIDVRKVSRAKLRAEVARALTFRQCADRCIADRRESWKNSKHAQQWENTLATYVYPHIGDLNVAEIDVIGVRKCLDPIWKTKTETATRVRQRMENVFDWAKAHNLRSDENPAAWKGHLQVVMASPNKIKGVEHHTALEVDRIAEFMGTLVNRSGTAALALNFLIQTACRTNEVLGATWKEVDFKQKIWTIPAERMKAGVTHQVPLSVETCEWLRTHSVGKANTAYLFEGTKADKPLSNMSMLELIRGLKLETKSKAAVTVHGFRSTFRQWAAEHSEHPREVAEHALAHRLPDKVEAAYQRGTLLNKRRVLMQDWYDFLFPGT